MFLSIFYYVSHRRQSKFSLFGILGTHGQVGECLWREDWEEKYQGLHLAGRKL